MELAIASVSSGNSLTRSQAAAALAVIMAGEASDEQISALLLGLKEKGETVDELAGLAQTMRSLATGVKPTRERLLDTCGTGGGRRTFNISTTAALIAAAAGCAVAKHGNRTATGLSGSADVLEALGAKLELSPHAEAQLIDEIGFGFMFAPAHHSATRYVVPVRKALAVPTVFNLLGPLTNPAGARRQLIGVADPALIDLVAGALAELGTDHALVVSSEDGLDEISTSGTTHVAELQGTEMRRYEISPQQFGIEPAAADELSGGGPDENAQVINSIFAGVAGPQRDIAVLNAAAAIYLGGESQSIEEGIAVAGAAIDSGAAAATLERYLNRSVELAAQ
ncbi:MAG: anthranilate phosphoribosyltransferase [Actinobacteria bacterium]|nr:anthranilate phosphoribosyltransferase [Actinomycetota bacterium]